MECGPGVRQGRGRFTNHSAIGICEHPIARVPLLDSVLTGLLDKVSRTLEKRSDALGGWRLGGEARRVNAIRLEVRQLAARVDNAIKFLSDMFAARLYRTAATKIGVPDYRLLVEQKLQSAGELYDFMIE